MKPVCGTENGKRYGISERLEPGDHARAEQFLDDTADNGIAHLRLAVILDVWSRPAGRDWYRWLTARAAERADVTAAIFRAAPEPGNTLPPAWIGDSVCLERFVAEVASELGKNCAWLELADALGPSVWPDISRASATLLGDLHLPTGRRVCLGGLPLNPAWLRLARDQGLFEAVQGLAFSRCGPGTDWNTGLARAAEVTSDCAPLQLWLTPEQLAQPTGRGAPEQALSRELAACGALLDSAAHRIYFRRRGTDGLDNAAEREVDGKPELVARIMRSGGSHALRTSTAPTAARPGSELVIGGAGFIGSNLAARLAGTGRQVVILDDLSRPGSEHNARWLQNRFPENVQLLLADVRDAAAVHHAVSRARRVFHFAAQVAVTTSLRHPLLDHGVNTLGTLNVLEAVRRQTDPPPLVFTSTNKVYGDLSDIDLQQTPYGYEPVEAAIRTQGIDETRPLAFSSPYGCSKGAADQYVLDYARTFHLPTAVLRMSCIYGPHQFGNEDQGWVAHFVRRALTGAPITIYGDGFQVRDVLYVEDLVNAALTVADHLPAIAGEVFNVGGGPFNKVSLRGLLDRLAALQGNLPPLHTRDWRPGDQRYYVSDTSRLQRLTGWHPRTNVGDGVRHLFEWMRQHLDLAPVTSPQHGERQVSL